MLIFIYIEALHTHLYWKYVMPVTVNSKDIQPQTVTNFRKSLECPMNSVDNPLFWVKSKILSWRVLLLSKEV